MSAAPPEPLLVVENLTRTFPSGEGEVAVLKDVSLSIGAGELVAIVGASGSGKSTLMNILGCLDRASAGSYRVGGRATDTLDPDALAELRREHFGFIFQRYHLLSDLSALGNVEVPAIYAGRPRPQRRAAALALLDRLGLAERTEHRPGQLSGGQQQRVSIARALVNGGRVILADEPTGALDTRSGEEVMRILQELHRDGHTVVIVTHDMKVAAHAERIIEIGDGRILADRPNRPVATLDGARAVLAPRPPARAGWRSAFGRFREAFRMAVLAMRAHPLRTVLTMLGIVIGIAAVVSVVALGQGSQQQILAGISAIGTNTLDIYPGSDFGDERADSIQTLVPADADALAGQDYIDSVTPSVSTNSTVRYGNVSARAQVNGVGEAYFRVRGLSVVEGAVFDRSAIAGNAQQAVIDDNTQRTLFPRGGAIGSVILVGQVPVTVVAVARRSQTGFGASDRLNVFLPYSTAMTRILGQAHLSGITVRVADSAPMAVAEQAVTSLLQRRHGTKDFYVNNIDSIRETIASTTQTMTLLISSIAVISLLVGGIGVMNIMLVSVTERTGEIGVRMAVGARASDILQQFLIEAVLVCLIGGVLGILLALGFGWAFQRFGSDFALSYSWQSIALAFGCSSLIGIAFGFLPARNAAKLDPVAALSRE